MKQISDIYLQKMANGAHFNFVGEIVASAKQDAKVINKAGNLLSALEAALALEDECIKLSQKSAKSDAIAAADQERDKFYANYKKAVKAYLDLPLPEMREKAAVLWQHIKDFNINPSVQMDRETGMLTNFTADLESKLAPQVAALSLTQIVAGMKEANERVRTLSLERFYEASGKQVGALKAARAKTDEAYYAFIRLVNALAVVFGDEDYAQYIDLVNTMITHYKRKALGQKSDAPDTNPDSGQTGGEGGSGDGGEAPGTGSGGNEEGGDEGGGTPGGGGSDFD